MKFLIASDIHGSAYWAERLMKAIEAEAPDRIILLGDLLYHGPRNDLPRDYAPKRVIPLLNDLAATGKVTSENRAHALDLLDMVGLREKAPSYPSQLSGGQQQRVAIARALNMNPKIILFDEPTSALDPEMIGEVADVIADLAKGNKTLVIVTHEMGLAREVADELVFMDEGSIVERGTPAQLFDQSPNPRLRAFFSKVLK